MSKLEIIKGWEVIKRMSEGTLKTGDQYRRLNTKYPISLFKVGEIITGEELIPSVSSFINDNFLVLKVQYNNLSQKEKEIAAEKLDKEVKEEALKIAASQLSREDLAKEIYNSEDCPSHYGLFDWCGQACKKCIRQAVNEAELKFKNE